MVTDLTTGILEGAVSENPEEKLFVVLFTDGNTMWTALPSGMAARLRIAASPCMLWAWVPRKWA